MDETLKLREELAAVARGDGVSGAVGRWGGGGVFGVLVFFGIGFVFWNWFSCFWYVFFFFFFGGGADDFCGLVLVFFWGGIESFVSLAFGVEWGELGGFGGLE